MRGCQTVSQFKAVATGGTFDVIHKGHMALLDKAFTVSLHVIIGLTSDDLAKRKGKKTLHTYEQRFEQLKGLIDKKFSGRSYVISKLDNDFGPAVIEGAVEALVVSEETSYQGKVLNTMREERGMAPVEVILVPMVLAEDGKRISSTRIRNTEIDAEGNLT